MNNHESLVLRFLSIGHSLEKPPVLEPLRVTLTDSN